MRDNPSGNFTKIREITARVINSDGLASPRSAAKFFLHSAGKEYVMSDFDLLSLRQVNDLGNKIGGQERAKRIMSGELVLVERNALQTLQALNPQVPANGGVTYASVLNTEAFLDDWSKFLKEVFKISLSSRKKILLPKTKPGFGWGVLTPRGMTIERVLESFNGICPIWRWTNDNLDKITKSVRNADNTRVIWVRDRVEADEEHRSKSYNDLKATGINGCTLLERLLLERWFSYKTNQHLDVSNVTRCDGSFDSDGDVPGVYWYDDYGRLDVHRDVPDDCRDGLRSREAVS